MKSAHQILVEQFMFHAKQEVPESPTIPDSKVRHLRARLILEESLETIRALGFAVTVPGFAGGHDIVLDSEDFSLSEFMAGPNLVDIIDGCVDISVVTTGTLSACGVPDMPFLDLVDGNNLSKFDPDKDGHWDEHGKWVRPSDHTPPDFSALLSDLFPNREVADDSVKM